MQGDTYLSFFFLVFFPNSIEVGILRSRGCYIKFPEASEVIVLSGGVSFCDSSNRCLDAFVNRRKTSKQIGGEINTYVCR